MWPNLFISYTTHGLYFIHDPKLEIINKYFFLYYSIVESFQCCICNSTELIAQMILVRNLRITCQYPLWPSQVTLVVKNLPANAGDLKRCRFNPWVRKIPWKRAWQPTPYSCPENPHEQMPGYSHRVVKSWMQMKQLSTQHEAAEYTALPISYPMNFKHLIRQMPT